MNTNFNSILNKKTSFNIKFGILSGYKTIILKTNIVDNNGCKPEYCFL